MLKEKKLLKLSNVHAPNNITKILLALLFAASTAFSCAHVVSYDDYYSFYVAIIVSAVIVGILFYWKYESFINTVRQSHSLLFLSFCFAAFFSCGSYLIRRGSCGEISFFFVGKLSYLFGYPSMVLITGCILFVSWRWLNDLRNRIDVADIQICIGSYIFLFAVMLIFLCINPNWYTQYDMVYSMDSGFCITKILPDPNYYDIRHPLLAIISFPVWATLVGIAKIAVPTQLHLVFCVVSVQALNIWMLVAIGAMLKAMSKSRTCLILYLVVFSTLLSAVAPEKYVISCFFVVATIYLLSFHARYAPIGYVLAIGVMPTNIFLIFAEFIKKDLIKTKLKRLVVTILVGVVAIVCSGHGDMLNIFKTLEEVRNMHTAFGSEVVSIEGRLISCINLLQGAFLPLTAGIQGEQYIWINLTDKMSLLAIPLLLVMLIGLMVKRREFAIKVAGLWIVFCFVLFVLFNWAPNTSVLFAPLFSWAIILLFSEGIDFLSEKLGFNIWVVLSVVSIFCVVSGILELVNINGFMSTYL